jgi:hypothetical protein
MPGIAAKQEVKDAVKRLCDDQMLKALFAVQEHHEWLQGTSPNETWHSWLNRYIRVGGGNRSYKVVHIGICLGIKRYNEGKLQRLTYGRNQQAQRSAAIVQALRQGLDVRRAAQRAFKLRTSWHEYMDAQHDLESLRTMGFRPSKVRAGTVLDDDSLERLYQGFLRVLSNEEFIHTADPAYWVAHHLADRQLTPWEVKQVFRYIEKQMKGSSA